MQNNQNHNSTFSLHNLHLRHIQLLNIVYICCLVPSVCHPNNSLILAQQNAGNIEVLKGRIDGLDGVKKRVDELQQNVDMMQTQIDGLVQQQADYAQELAGNQPIEVTGTGTETVEDVENSIEEEDKI